MSETIVYRYGAKSPIENAAEVAGQIRLARVYRNRLIEIERGRRCKVEDVLKEYGAEELAAARSRVDELESALGTLRMAANRKNAEARSKRASADMRGKITEVRSELKTARAAVKERRKALFADPAVLARLKELDAVDLSDRKLARAQCGVYWGTYLHVEESLKDVRKGAPPQFRSWDGSKSGRAAEGSGSVVVQVQGGMTIEELTGGNDSRLRLTAWRDGRHLLWLRVGSTEDRRPVWAKFPVTIHRPFPPGGRIMWCRVKRHVIGTQHHWTALFTVRGGERGGVGKDGRYAKSAVGSVGIDVGWRVTERGLRVCCWRGDDGAAGELVLPADLLARWPKSRSLRSIRDRNFDRMRAELANWIEALESPPAWLKEAISTPPRSWSRQTDTGEAQEISPRMTLRAWRSPARLGRVAWIWSANRFDGDEAIFEKLAGWRKQDRHLWNWESSNVAKAIARRLDIYRNFAAMLSRRYATACVEDTDWAALNRVPEGEEDGALRANFRVAAVGSLIECVKRKMRTMEVPAANTTRTCRHCGAVLAFDAAALHRICGSCGAVDDQDQNAAEILLRAGMGGAGLPASVKMPPGSAGDARGPDVSEGCGANPGQNGGESNEETGRARGGRFRRRRQKDLACEP